MERETRAAAEQRPAQRVAALGLYSELPGQARHWDTEKTTGLDLSLRAR